MKRIVTAGALSFSLMALLGCKEESSKPSTVKPAEVKFKKEGELSIYKSESDSLIKTIDIEIADSDYERQTGLMYRKTMEENHGMLFIFPQEEYQSFYMRNTQIPLDIIYLNSELEIVSIQKNAKPLSEDSLPSEAPAQYVLEISAGLSDQWNLEPGDKVSYTK